MQTMCDKINYYFFATALIYNTSNFNTSKSMSSCISLSVWKQKKIFIRKSTRNLVRIFKTQKLLKSSISAL